MGQTTVSIRMDEDVKKQFDDFCNEVGLNMSVAINLFAKTVIREKRIPFDIYLGNTSSQAIDGKEKKKEK